MGDWSRVEVEAVVADYLTLLTLELAGTPYNKAATRRALARRLDGRSESSIERKRQNISAILKEESRPYIWGYKPLANYQRLLRDVVVDWVDAHPELEPVFEAAVDARVSHRDLRADALTEEAPPKREQPSVGGERRPVRRMARRIDYFAREAANRSIGLAGERLVLEFERWTLRKAGQPALAEKVRHVSVEDGDGLGFDIRSYDRDGSERFIEVKSTSFGKETPFFVSRCEVEVSQELGDHYHLYRVFKLREQPSVFTVPGPLSDGFVLMPEVFRARRN